ncbi:MAG TPA: CvpA family protein [Verrucomicrobiae bacterium]|nr:CvpA family protein [Verrucomicrobiae bacterium]
MIAAATQAAPPSGFLDELMTVLNNLPFGWFDVAAVAILAFGFFRGRKNGMTKEVLPMLQWVCTIIVCGLGYEMAGAIFINTFQMSKTVSFVLGYLVLTLIVYFVFMLLKNSLTPRLTGSNIFGSSEYYLGMISGMIRYACLIIFALAFLNAPYYSPADIAKAKAFNARWFGGGEEGYSGNFFPSLQQVQTSVFKSSLIGPCVTNYLGMLVIKQIQPDVPKPPPKKVPVIKIGD